MTVTYDVVHELLDFCYEDTNGTNVVEETYLYVRDNEWWLKDVSTSGTDGIRPAHVNVNIRRSTSVALHQLRSGNTGSGSDAGTRRACGCHAHRKVTRDAPGGLARYFLMPTLQIQRQKWKNEKINKSLDFFFRLDPSSRVVTRITKGLIRNEMVSSNTTINSQNITRSYKRGYILIFKTCLVKRFFPSASTFGIKRLVLITRSVWTNVGLSDNLEKQKQRTARVIFWRGAPESQDRDGQAEPVQGQGWQGRQRPGEKQGWGLAPQHESYQTQRLCQGTKLSSPQKYYVVR